MKLGLLHLAGLASVLALTACGGGQTHPNLFATDWNDDGGQAVAAVWQKLAGVKAPAGVNVAVGVAGNDDKLVGISLDGGAKWTFPHAIEVRPAIAGGVVVCEGGGELFALDAATGRKLWARNVGPALMRGAGDDGKVTVVSLEQNGGAGSILLAVGRDGGVVRQMETDKQLGVPAVLGGYVFVPWQRQYVSIIDLTNGDEAARILLRGKASHAFTEGGGLYFGEQELFRWDAHIKDGSRNQATRLTLPDRELPGTPALFQPGEQHTAPIALALDKARLYARPASPDGPTGFDTSRFYGSYFRLVMAFDTTKGSLAWVHSDKSDVLGGAPGPGSFTLCDEEGNITVVDAQSGGTAKTLALGEPVKSCTVQADTLQATGATPPPPLVQQIAAALTNRDAEMVAGQRLLLREMAQLQDELVTKTLVDLASDPRTAPPLLKDARTDLAARRNGKQYMLDALAKHYDFLHDVLRPPPVGPIAQALGAMKEKSAAPLLAAHLLDPADTDDDVQQAAVALVEIGDAAQAPELAQFFALYHAGAGSPEVALAAASAGQALLKVGGKNGRATVDAAIEDPLTLGPVRERLIAIEQSMDAQKSEAPAADAGKGKGKKPEKKDKKKK